MNERLYQFIQYRTGGNQAEFASLMGWSPQYLRKKLKKGSIGIRTIVSLLEKFPELNARWLLLGEGAMITPRGGTTHQLSSWHIERLQNMDIERYIPYMSSEEQSMTLAFRLKGGLPLFDQARIDVWERQIAAQEAIERGEQAPLNLSDGVVCKPTKAK